MAVMSRIMSGQWHVTGHNARLITWWLRSCFFEIGFIAGRRVRVGTENSRITVQPQQVSFRLCSRRREGNVQESPQDSSARYKKTRAFGMTGRIGKHPLFMLESRILSACDKA